MTENNLTGGNKCEWRRKTSYNYMFRVDPSGPSGTCGLFFWWNDLNAVSIKKYDSFFFEAKVSMILVVPNGFFLVFIVRPMRKQDCNNWLF